jgi:hypothetical protein
VRDLLAKLCFCAYLMVAPATAQEIETGTGLICDTEAQVARYLELYDGDVHAAVTAVNVEAADTTACGVATVAYMRVEDKARVDNKNGSHQITEILVVGIHMPFGIASTPPTV